MLNPHPYPYEQHHKIQRTIKRWRTKNQTINFPTELLNSNPYKFLLRKKVSSNVSFYGILYDSVALEDNAERTVSAAILRRVRGLVDS